MFDIDFNSIDFEAYGNKMYSLIERLYPICRSITGNGVRETLAIIKEQIPEIVVHEVQSGTEVFDWTIPKEWNIRDAWVKNSRGEKIIDFKESNLHVLNYSIPIYDKMNLEELKKHLFTLEQYPDRIPYLTSYYKENWGFCLTYNQFKKLEEDTYEVFIDSSLEDGYLTYGELYIKGEVEDEVMFSTYLCHPSLCNDNLSGVSLLTYLAEFIKDKKLHYSYRFIFIPETIGAITWLCRNEGKVNNIKYGLVASCVGDNGEAMNYKRSRIGNAEIDRIVEKVLIDSGQKYGIMNYFPSGSDERQFCSPGFNLPFGCFMRTTYGEFNEYHTSADNLDFVSIDGIGDSLKNYIKVVYYIENNGYYINVNSKCEPQLGKRGLYDMIGGKPFGDSIKAAILWLLSYCDGSNSLLDIAIRAGLKFEDVANCANVLKECGLLRRKSNYE